MNIAELNATLQASAVVVVFVNVLLQQLGLPIPAVPTLLVAGSLAASYGQAGQLLAVSVLASMIADWVWYLAGRAFGYRVLSGLCRLSLNPGSCVSGAEALFVRWGAGSLVVAKFVPGFSTVGPPIAGSLRMPLPSFLAAAGLGAALWAGGAIFVGWLLRDEVQWAIEAISRHAVTAVAVIALVLGLWISWKMWQKRRFERMAAIPHISIDELMVALASQTPPLLLDLRGEALLATAGPIEGATSAQLENLAEAAGQWPKHHPVVTLCACPEDATAVHAARSLMKLGYQSARPLKGGYEAWQRRLEKPDH